MSINCDVCGKRATGSCSRCKCAAYCSEGCADRDWEDGGHHLECFAHDESALEHVAKDLDLGAHMFFNVPLDEQERAIGERIVAQENVEEAIEWLRVNRMLHANPESPDQANEWFQARSEELVGLRSPSEWWAEKKKARTTKKFNRLVNLEEERNKTKWYQFGKRRKLRRQQQKELKKWF